MHTVVVVVVAVNDFFLAFVATVALAFQVLLKLYYIVAHFKAI